MFPFLSLSLSFFKQQQKNSFIFSVKTNPTTNLPSFHFIHFTLHTFISHFHLIFTLTHPQSNNKNTFIISLSLINSLSQPTKSPYKLYIIQIPTHTTINISSRRDRKTVQHCIRIRWRIPTLFYNCPANKPDGKTQFNRTPETSRFGLAQLEMAKWRLSQTHSSENSKMISNNRI